MYSGLSFMVKYNHLCMKSNSTATNDHSFTVVLQGVAYHSARNENTTSVWPLINRVEESNTLW
jgi:hypothetical protein